MRKIKYPAIYKHFKNNYYAVKVTNRVIAFLLIMIYHP